MHNLIARAQMQMIGVGQLDLTTDVFQIRRTQRALDRALRTDIHKYRGLYRSVRTGKYTAPRRALGFQKFKHTLPLCIRSLPIFLRR